MSGRATGFDLRQPIVLVTIVIVLGTALRLGVAGAIGLGVDESYAVVIARQPSLAYFDHPPLAFWIVGMFARLAGSERAFIVRLPFILLFAGTTWLMYRLGTRLFGAWAGAYAALMLNLAPVFSVSTGGWVLPDGPLMFFMLATTICLARLFVGDILALRWWTLAGVFAGLALLSKYQAVFLAPGLLLFLITRRDQRRWLLTPGPYIGAIVATVLFLPVLIWNARHGWVSFRFQLGRGAAPAGGIHPLAMLQNIAGQMGYLLPWIWLPLIILLGHGLARGPQDAKRWLLICLAIWPIGVFTLAALGGKPGLPHWPAPGYLLLFPLLGEAIASRIVRTGGGGAKGRKNVRDVRVRRWLVASTVAFLVLVAIAATQTATGWMTRLMPSLFRRGDPTLEALDWTELRTVLAQRGLLRVDDGYVGATSWIEAGKIGYALGPKGPRGPGMPILCLCEHPHHFGYLHDQRAFLGHDALLLDRTRGSSDAERRYESYFVAIDSLAPVFIHRAGSTALTIAVFRAHDFRVPYPMDIP